MIAAWRGDGFPVCIFRVSQSARRGQKVVNKRDDVRVQSWPQLPIFGASIPDTVKGAIEKTDVLVCDITRPNLNVYYEIGYCIGLAKSVAPVINASFTNATSDIQKDGLLLPAGARALAPVSPAVPQGAHHRPRCRGSQPSRGNC
jgi:hypothetical protein